eukprot:scaffold24529_cov140-Isochrysis_galbana.AAC.10
MPPAATWAWVEHMAAAKRRRHCPLSHEPPYVMIPHCARSDSVPRSQCSPAKSQDLKSKQQRRPHSRKGLQASKAQHAKGGPTRLAAQYR